MAQWKISPEVKHQNDFKTALLIHPEGHKRNKNSIWNTADILLKLRSLFKVQQ